MKSQRKVGTFQQQSGIVNIIAIRLPQDRRVYVSFTVKQKLIAVSVSQELHDSAVLV